MARLRLCQQQQSRLGNLGRARIQGLTEGRRGMGTSGKGKSTPRRGGAAFLAITDDEGERRAPRRQARHETASQTLGD